MMIPIIIAVTEQMEGIDPDEALGEFDLTFDISSNIWLYLLSDYVIDALAYFQLH